MEYTVEDLSPVKKKVAITTDPKEVEAAIMGAVALYKTSVQIDGFRKGKVPASVIEQRFRDRIYEEARQDLVNVHINEVMSKLDVTPVSGINMVDGEPVFTDYVMNNPDGLSPKEAVGSYSFAQSSGPFVLSSAQTSQLGARFLRIACPAVPLTAVNFLISYTLQAMGKGLQSAILTFSRQGLLNIPLLIIMDITVGLYGMIWTQLLVEVIMLPVSFGMYMHTLKGLKVKEQEA